MQLNIWPVVVVIVLLLMLLTQCDVRCAAGTQPPEPPIEHQGGSSPCRE